MSDAESYAVTRLKTGAPDHQVLAELCGAGWSDDAAGQAVRAAGRAVRAVPESTLEQPSRGLLVTALVFAVLTPAGTVTFILAIAAHWGPPRELVSTLAGPLMAGYAAYAALAPVACIVTLVLLLVHGAHRRRAVAQSGIARAHVRFRPSALLRWAWALFAVSVPLWFVVAGGYIIWIMALGAMCGEAVSAGCGLGN
jgi:heme exporter protein D